MSNIAAHDTTWQAVVLVRILMKHANHTYTKVGNDIPSDATSSCAKD